MREALRDAQRASLAQPTPTSETRSAAAESVLTEAEELINRAVTVQEKFYGSDSHLISASWFTKVFPQIKFLLTLVFITNHKPIA